MHAIFYFKLSISLINQIYALKFIINMNQMRILWILIKDPTFPIIHR